MPKHYAVGENIQGGEVKFNGTKSLKVTYAKEFKNVPKVKLTLLDNSSSNPYVIERSKTDFTIKFTNSQSDTRVTWEATE